MDGPDQTRPRGDRPGVRVGGGGGGPVWAGEGSIFSSQGPRLSSRPSSHQSPVLAGTTTEGKFSPQ